MEQIITQEKSKKQNYHTLKVLFEKETADFINGKRMLLFILLMALITVTGLYAAVSGLADALESGNSSADFLFLKLFTVSANSIPSYNSLMALMGPFIGIFMGFDAINSERTEGTLNRLVSQPLYRDHIIIGKFLAGIFITAVMVFSSGILIAAAGLISTGLVPTGQRRRGYLFIFAFAWSISASGLRWRFSFPPSASMPPPRPWPALRFGCSALSSSAYWRELRRMPFIR